MSWLRTTRLPCCWSRMAKIWAARVQSTLTFTISLSQIKLPRENCELNDIRHWKWSETTWKNHYKVQCFASFMMIMGMKLTCVPKTSIQGPQLQLKLTKPNKSRKESLAPSKKKEWWHRSVLDTNDRSKEIHNKSNKESSKHNYEHKYAWGWLKKEK